VCREQIDAEVGQCKVAVDVPEQRRHRHFGTSERCAPRSIQHRQVKTRLDTSCRRKLGGNDDHIHARSLVANLRRDSRSGAPVAKVPVDRHSRFGTELLRLQVEAGDRSAVKTIGLHLHSDCRRGRTRRPTAAARKRPTQG